MDSERRHVEDTSKVKDGEARNIKVVGGAIVKHDQLLLELVSILTTRRDEPSGIGELLLDSIGLEDLAL